MRRVLSVVASAGLAAGALVGVLAAPGSAGVTTVPTTIAVVKTVEGAATGPFTVFVNCSTVGEATVNFDASGAPTTFSGNGPQWQVVDGMWQFSFDNVRDQDCSATEIDADGATSTSWTCEEFIQTTNGTNPGCAASSGDGTGPVNFNFAGSNLGVDSQRVLVRFTNVVLPPEPVVPAPVVVAPLFTG